MREETANSPTVDWVMDTFIAHPEAGGPHPPVVLCMDVWGVREHLRDWRISSRCTTGCCGIYRHARNPTFRAGWHDALCTRGRAL